MLSDFSEIYKVIEKFKSELSKVSVKPEVETNALVLTTLPLNASNGTPLAQQASLSPKSSAEESLQVAKMRPSKQKSKVALPPVVQILKNEARVASLAPHHSLSVPVPVSVPLSTSATEPVLMASPPETTFIRPSLPRLEQDAPKGIEAYSSPRGKARSSSWTSSHGLSKENSTRELRKAYPLKTWLSCLVLSLKSESPTPFVAEDLLKKHLDALEHRLRAAQRLLRVEARPMSNSSSGSDDEEKAYQTFIKTARLSCKHDFDMAHLLKSDTVFPGPCYVFMDHSNTLVGAQEYMSDWINRKILARSDIGLNYRALLKAFQQCHRPIMKMFIAGSDSGSGSNACDEQTDVRGCLKQSEMSDLTKSLGSEHCLEILTLRRVFRSGAYREQCVDELLHNRILETLLEAEQPSLYPSRRSTRQYSSPGTLILVTGDGSQGEFGRGFFCYVLKALSRQWHVECHSWTPTLSSNYLKLANHPRFKFVPLEKIATDLLLIQSV